MSRDAHRKLVERGRRLASQRETLILAGVDPAELPVPLYPVAPPPPGVDPVEAGHLRQLAAAWTITTCGCVTAVVACMTSTGALLVVHDGVTWQAMCTAGAGVVWLAGVVASSLHAFRLGRRARALTIGDHES